MNFKKRPIAISADYRPIFRMALIALVLYICSSRKRASLLKLHLFSWALKSSENMESVFNLLVDRKETVMQRWSIEPSLNRALRLGVSEGIFVVDGDKYSLAEKGEKLAISVLKDSEVLIKEKNFLSQMGKKLSEKRVLEISKNWFNNA